MNVNVNPVVLVVRISLMVEGKIPTSNAPI
jgi:hypothetical protein